MKEKMFEEASKQKLRFNTTKGMITVEDLWDVPLLARSGQDLDSLAKSLNKAVKDSGEESFVLKKNEVNSVLELKFEIVKRVIEVKIEEAEKREKTAENKATKERIMSIIDGKKDEALMGKSVDELTKLIKELS